MIKRTSSAIVLLILCLCTANAQNDSFNDFRNRMRDNYSSHRETIHKNFEEFRRKRNEEFAEFVRNAWAKFESKPEIVKPKEDELPPITFDDAKQEQPVPLSIPFDEVVTINDSEPQPEPIEPIEELPKDNPILEGETFHEFSFWGTSAKIRFNKSKALQLQTINENAVADAWMELSEPHYTNLVHDCLTLRKTHNLCDWAYLQMLEQMSYSVCGKDTNEATLLMAYVYCQSGYKMRLAIGDGRLCMLYASKHKIYNQGYFDLDGEMFYPYAYEGQRLSICNAKYPKEQSMSLQIPQEMVLAWQGGDARTIKSKRYPDMEVQAISNKNMLDFYSSYPSSEINGNFVSCWAMYANTPMPAKLKKTIYPAISQNMAGLSQKEAVERLLNWVQTGFEYEYDDKVWGGDRAFFPEETFYYPYCDCEDRSILLTRMVRDLLGLDCLLVYYPGHLACAVCFEEEVSGDYILLDNRRYVVCDPTYIGAPVGRTMPNMDNSTAKVILLN